MMKTLMAAIFVSCLVAASWQIVSTHQREANPENPSLRHRAGLYEIEAVDRDQPMHRRPIALVKIPNRPRLLVANQQSGSISVIDTLKQEVIGEWKVATRIGDLVHWHDDSFLLTDQTIQGRLICVQVSLAGVVDIVWQESTVGSPNKIVVNDEGSCCFVGGLWSRRIAKHWLANEKNESGGQQARPAPRTENLSLAAGVLALIDDQSTILVTDAFASRWASFAASDLSPLQSGDLDSQRICGIAPLISGKNADDLPKLAVVTQPLNRLAQAVRNDVHWGLMVANEVAIKDEQFFVDPEWKESRRTTIPLGGPGEAKGDPESIAFSPNGEVAITIGGMQQVAIGDLDDRSFAFIPTGARPIDCCFSDDDQRAWVANHLDDSITVVDVENYEVFETIELGKQPAMTAEDRGERLFFDARVSHDGWMSCHSCHVNGHTSGFLNDNFSDQSFGAPKRVLSLLGHGDTAPFAWNGSAATLEDQVKSSIEITMQTDDEFTDQQIAELAAFVRSMPAPPSLAVARGEASKEIDAGKKLFAELGCSECHRAPNYTTPQLRAVGLVDELGKKEFNPPSLIGVSQRQEFFHDARFSSLKELFVDDKHQLKRDLTDDELVQLLAFLGSL